MQQLMLAHVQAELRSRAALLWALTEIRAVALRLIGMRKRWQWRLQAADQRCGISNMVPQAREN